MRVVFHNTVVYPSVIFSLLILHSFNFQLFAQDLSEIIRIQAESRFDDGNFGEAINLLNRYISANPDEAYGYNLRGLCFENRKEYEKAVYDFRSALKLEPKNEKINENLNRTIEKWETLLYNRIVGYKREIEINPDKPSNFLEIGRSFKNLGDWLQAEKWYDEYLNRENPSADELIRYTEILAKNNHILKGESWLRIYCEKYPDDHRLWSRYGYFTMWLGKKQTSMNAFSRAIELRPYFKEALDGYDLVRGKGYIYTVNDTTVRYNFGLPVTTVSHEYPIDKYYRKITENPEDQESRILLVEELLNNSRFSEAENQLDILISANLSGDIISKLKNELSIKKESYYWQRSNELEEILIENPSDEQSAIELANIYAERKDFDKGLNILSNFMNSFPASDKLIYNFALISSWAGDLQTAYSTMVNLLNRQPEKIDYQLLCGRLLVWLNKDLTTASKYLENVLLQNPHNYEALITMSLLLLQSNELKKSQYYLDKATQIKKSDIEILKIMKMIEGESKLNYEREMFAQLKQAREYLFSKECEKSVKLFKDYLKKDSSNVDVRKELAQAYLCKGDYVNAILVYDDLLAINPSEYDLRKMRAKILFWGGYYPQAQNEFERLSAIDSDDAEVKLLLGDSYTALEDFYNARRVYYELLEISPSSFILKERLSWIDDTPAGGFPAHIIFAPDAYYFIDNFDFLYSTYGLRLDLGVSEFLTLGASGYGGVIGSDSTKNNISIFKGIVSTRLSKLVQADAAFGATFFPGNESSFLAEASIKVEKPNRFIFSVNFFSTDAAQTLYSPFLVNVRLGTNIFTLQGNYITLGKWKFFGSYSLINVSDNNRANKLVLRFGKIFQNTVGTGYEYYYYDVKNQTNLYWSPENFESHSIWADWNLADDKLVSADIGGKLGYIPEEEFVLREFYGVAVFKLESSLSLQTRLAFGSTVQSGRGYSSTSFSITAFWTL